MAINPNEYTISYDKMLKSTTLRERFNMAQNDNTFYSQLAQALTPTQLANLFPRYYRDRLPDISGFTLATEQIAAGTFGKGLPSPTITGEATNVGTRPVKPDKQIGTDAETTGKVKEEKLRDSLPGNVRTAFDEVVRKKKARAFSTTDDPFSGLSDEELKTIGIKRIQRSGPQAEAGSFYVKDTLSVAAAKQKVLSQYKTESKVTGFKFEDAPTTFPDNKYTGNYYRTHGAGMGNKEDNNRIQTELANYIAKKGKEAGYTDAAIKGMVANANSESFIGLLPYGDKGNSGGVFHLNKDGAAAEAGVDPKKYHVNKDTATVDEYIAAMKDSIDESFDLFQNDNSYAGLNEILKTSNDFNETTTAFVKYFEKPSEEKISHETNAAQRAAAAKKLGIDTAVLEESVSEENMPKFIETLKTMDEATLEKFKGVIETGPGGMGAGINIVDLAESLQTPEDINKFEAELARMYDEKGLTPGTSEVTAEQVKGIKGSWIEGYDPEKVYDVRYNTATKEYINEQFLPHLNMYGAIGFGKAIGENPYVQHGVFSEDAKTVTGHATYSRHKGYSERLAADISTGQGGIRPKFIALAGNEKTALKLNQALGRLMKTSQMRKLLKPDQLINQGEGFSGASTKWSGKRDYGHYRHVHDAPGVLDDPSIRQKIPEILFNNPEYFGDAGVAFKDLMVENGLWVPKANGTGYKLNPEKYPEFADQLKEDTATPETVVKEEEIKAATKVEETTSTEESPYLGMPLERLQKMLDEEIARGYTLAEGSEESYASQKKRGLLLQEIENTKNYTPESEEEPTQPVKSEDLMTLYIDEKKVLMDLPYETPQNLKDEQRNKVAYLKKQIEQMSSVPEAEPVKEEQSADLGTTRFYEGGTFKAKDDLKVVREDGSPTGIRIASDETAMIIPPDERRKARDIVSLDGTDQRDGFDTMDEDKTNVKPVEAPLNQAKMSTGNYAPSNLSTIPSSLGVIDYSPSALRAYMRDKYFDNHGYHSAPRTIYAQK